MYIDTVVVASLLTVLGVIIFMGWFVWSFVRAGQHYDALEDAKKTKRPRLKS